MSDFKPRWSNEATEVLAQAFTLLKDQEESLRLLDDLCTVSELEALGQRLQVAKLLNRNMTYTQIAEETGASTATISRVKRFLNFGSGGYRIVLERMGEMREEP